ncbi:hypothetical protein bcgnr5369_68680 [Bacillus cereus]
MYFVIHKNCFYLCLLTVFVVDSFNCEFRPLLVNAYGGKIDEQQYNK